MSHRKLCGRQNLSSTESALDEQAPSSGRDLWRALPCRDNYSYGIPTGQATTRLVDSPDSVLDERRVSAKSATMREAEVAAEAGAAAAVDLSSPVLAVVEQLQEEMVGVVEAKASARLPECHQIRSCALDAELFTYEHPLSWCLGDEQVSTYGGDDTGSRMGENACPTCDEVISHSLRTRTNAGFSWVPYPGQGDGGDEISPGMYKRLAVQISTEGLGLEKACRWAGGRVVGDLRPTADCSLEVLTGNDTLAVK